MAHILGSPFHVGFPQFVIRDGCDRYGKDLSSNRGKAADKVQEIADEPTRAHRVGDVGMRRECRNVYGAIRWGSSRSDRMGREESVVQAMQCMEG